MIMSAIIIASSILMRSIQTTVLSLKNYNIAKLNEFCNYFGICLDYICGLTNTKKYEISNLDINKIILGQNIKKTRTKHNDTQETVAKTIGVDQSNYSKYELGKILIHTYPLIEFAKYYNVSIDWLCGKTKDSNIK